MEFRQVKYFLALAEYRNFTRAANVLHIAQPTLSQQISELERSLDVKLLRRTKRSVELTAAGQAFLSEALLLQEQYYHCHHVMDTYRSGESGKLTLVTLDTFETTFLPDFFARFCTEHPDISVTHITGTFCDIQQMLLRHTADVAINVIEPLDLCPELVSTLINRDRLVLAASDTPELHGLSSFDDPRIGSLLSRRCLLWSGWYNSAPVLDFLKARSPAFTCSLLETVSPILMRVLSGSCYTVLPELYLDSFLRDRPLLRVPFPEPYCTLDVSVLRHSSNTNPCALRFLREAKDYLEKGRTAR